MKKVLFFIFLLCSCSRNKIDSNLIIKNFDLNRYLGKWYEVARYDNWFEKNLIDVTAEYNLLENGKVKIVNKGYDAKNKKYKDVSGVGYLPIKDVGHLRISFFRPFYSDYNIIFLDNEYKYAVVSGGDYKYLWILSRSPAISEKLYQELLVKVESVGFNTEKIMKN